MSNTRTIGIDFGTHKTLVARWDEENRRPALIRLRPASGDDMPSVVHVDTGGTLTFGEEAEQLGAHDAEGCQRAFKRDLGINAAPYLLHAHEYSARDLAREYLRWIKALVEEESLHGPVDYAVITVPASWLPAARAELRQAAADAGFTSIELLDEPVAAGLAFLQSRRDLWAEGALLIFDWGAGTLDLAVLTLADGRPQSMPDLVGGKPGLGGEDIDRHLLQSVNKRLVQLGLTRLERRAAGELEHVRRKVHDWKIRHTAKPGAVWPLTGLADVSPEAGLKWTSEEIAERIGDKIKEAVDACAELLERAKAKGVIPAGALLVGGSSQFPALKSALEERFPGMRLLPWDQRISAVALGAAWQAALHAPAAPASSAAQQIPPDAPPAQASLIHGEKITIKLEKNYGETGLPWVPAFHLGGRYGLVDQTGGLLAEPRWDKVGRPSEGMLAFASGKKWGFVDVTGRLVIPPEWDDAGTFYEGLASMGVINTKFDMAKLTAALDDDSIDYSVKMEMAGGLPQHGFLDKQGRVVCPPQWYYTFRSPGGNATVQSMGKTGLIDRAGRLVVPVEWDDVSYDFADDLLRVTRNNRRGFVNRAGQVVIPPVWDDAHNFSEGLACVQSSGKWGFIDKTGTVAIPAGWDEARSFAGGCAAVKRDGKAGYIDQAGNTVLPFEWDEADGFGDGMALVKRNGKYGFIARTGAVTIPLEWDEVSGFSEGLHVVKRDGKYGFIDRTGAVVIPLEWDAAASFSHGFAKVWRGGSVGLLNRKGEVFLEPSFDDITIESTSDHYPKFVMAHPSETPVQPVVFIRVMCLLQDGKPREAAQRSPEATLALLASMQSAGASGQAIIAYLDVERKPIWSAKLVAEVEAERNGSAARSKPVDPWADDDGIGKMEEVKRRLDQEQEAYDWSRIDAELKAIGVRFTRGKLELFDNEDEMDQLGKITRICGDAPLFLDLYGADWRDHHLETLSRLTKVRLLLLGGCPRLTDATLRSVARMTSLKAIEITCHGNEVSRMTLEGFRALTHISGLRYLEFPKPYFSRNDMSGRERRNMKQLLADFAEANPYLGSYPELDDFEDD